MRLKFCFVLLVSLLLLAHLQTTDSFAIFSMVLNSVVSMTKFSGNWCLTAFTGFLGFHGSEVLFSMMRGDRDKFADLQKDMREGFEKLNEEISTSSEVIVNRLSTQIYANAEFNRVFHRIEEYLLIIETQFKNLQKLLRGEKEFQNDTLHKTADYLISSHEGTVWSTLYKLDIIINERSISSQLSKGTIMAVINYMKALHDVKHCDSITAPMEVMYVFLHYLAMMHLKGMVTIQAAFNLLARISNKEVGYKAEYQRIEQETHDHIKNLMQHMDKLNLLSPYSFSCMPERYVEHRNYEKLEKFLPVYLASEYGLEHYYKRRTQQATMYCSETCPFYDIAYFYKNPKQRININTVNRCWRWGMVRNCRSAEISGKICMEPSNATQLYTKHNGNCSWAVADLKTSQYEFYQCETCQCVCDTHVGQNFIYTAPRMAPEGAVVTGVRFEKHNNAILLNIETASALPFAFANNSDAHWQEDPPKEKPRKNRDKYTQMFHWCRHFTLTDVRVAKDQVVVGVQLYPVPGKRCTFNLRVFGKQINMLNGQFTGAGIVAYETKVDASAEVIDMSDLLSGVDRKAQQVTSAEDGPKLIKLSNSVLSDNYGQNTLPYFDTQQVATSPRMMQGGVGIYYRTTDKYAGHMAPRLIAFNSMDYLNEIEKKPDVIRDQLSRDVKASELLSRQSALDHKAYDIVRGVQ